MTTKFERGMINERGGSRESGREGERSCGGAGGGEEENKNERERKAYK